MGEEVVEVGVGTLEGVVSVTGDGLSPACNTGSVAELWVLDSALLAAVLFAC